VDRFLSRLAARALNYTKDARRLHRLLIEPAKPALRGKKVVAIVADGSLWRLPFQALIDDRGVPMAARYTLFFTPSLASLLRAPAALPAKPAILAVGNPRISAGAAARVRSWTRASFGDLPDAAREAREIASLYDAERSRLLIGSEATETVVKAGASRFDVVHLAAHALAVDTHPLYSSILLAGGGDDDGLLEGREITRLALNARLAVLSACSTAQGSVRPGEGLIGLSWAFLIAGCPTIVASQWAVESDSTATLMIELHRELARGGVPVAEALRRAQMRLMKNPRYRHPYYWSPFVVVGAGRS
jgi:CHAT domain-containing protein